mmetsp:Transcript_15345/g.28232  ORF Transcript_15345/g.28232 Transcript_15345/m.28232 type:complete len:87 (+) Transcript_15345:722-982(+)
MWSLAPTPPALPAPRRIFCPAIAPAAIGGGSWGLRTSPGLGGAMGGRCGGRLMSSGPKSTMAASRQSAAPGTQAVTQAWQPPAFMA